MRPRVLGIQPFEPRVQSARQAWPRSRCTADVETHQLPQRRSHRVRWCDVEQPHTRARRCRREVHEDVHALRRRERQHAYTRHGSGQQPAVRADDRERHPLEREVVKPVLGAVEQPEPVDPPVDRVARPSRPVDDRDDALDVAHPGRCRIRQGAVLVEVAVLEQQRQLVGVTDREAELGLERVADEVEPGQARVHVQPRGAHGVVVVPQRRRPLAARMLAVRVAVDGGLPRHRPQVREPVLPRRHASAVQVGRRPRHVRELGGEPTTVELGTSVVREVVVEGVVEQVPAA